MTAYGTKMDPDRLKARRFPERTFSYDDARTMLYGLAAGMSADPLDRTELPFVTENGLRALPSMATVIAWDDTWLASSGVDVDRVVHGEQRITLHKPLAPMARLSSAMRIVDVYDKGEGRGAVLYVRTDLTDLSDGQALATLHSTVFARGDGGFGGAQGNPPPLVPVPDSPCDLAIDLATQPNQALFYRLLGDRNPLHSDPDFARSVGFERPILHGLCTYAIATRAVVKGLCAHDPARVAHLEARFTAPVFPGETITTELWRTAEGGAFRARVAARESIVLDRGRVVLR
ncbi:MaoC/PaaZ C-terminal domain-containing protein [Mesorhizobium sp. KR9-304]|uniref:MaoC/PaaZ C-terminal domain-containing protein n=1 Tax=Mesorhizobium sp. KR9-304 TaxID=3156614 RepID=UPI0032B429DC